MYGLFGCHVLAFFGGIPKIDEQDLLSGYVLAKDSESPAD